MWRLFTGLALIAVTIGSVAASVIVISQHLAFAPVLSSSMEPTLHPGDLIVTRPEPANSVHAGQIVALPIPGSPGQRYVHRIIGVSRKAVRPVVWTKGDANAAPESFVLRIDSPTVPVVIASVPDLGRVSVLLQHPATRLTIIAITICAILLAAWRLLAGLWLVPRTAH